MPRALIPVSLSLVILCGMLAPNLKAQDCAPPPITANSKASNIFSPEQEMILGDLTYQRMANDYHFIRDPQLQAYINSIGEKLVKHLPPTGIKFQFFIVDMADANAFDVPGGYIFISRKLIGFANNEDELAGVIAHELGHGVVRHVAIEFSDMFKQILNVTSVGDRKDIVDKYNLLIERSRTKVISHQSSEESHQLEADRAGLFAMVAAGYDPGAVASIFDRLVETKGKTGGWFTNIFGGAKPDEKRLGAMIKLSQQLPPQCRDNHQASASQEFLKWQADVVSYRGTNKSEELSGLLWKKELSPKLHSDISHFAFSLDGKYFLAQDDFAVTVIQREPLQVAFQIPAPDADDASFTPDSQYVVFATESLRHEKWSIAEKKPVQVRELVVNVDCWEHGFSPDGNYLVCVDFKLNLKVIATQTGKKVWEEKQFYHLNVIEYTNWLTVGRTVEDPERKRFFNIEFSPDSQVLVVSRTSRFRGTLLIDSRLAIGTIDTVVALNLSALKTMKTGGDLKVVTRRSFVFLDANRILGMASDQVDDSGIFSFPEGKRLAKFPFGSEVMERTGNPNYVIVRPLANAKMGIFDISRNAIVSASDKVDAALWGNLLVFESASGKVLLSEFHYDETKKSLQTTPLTTIDIPVASVGQVYAIDVSSNLHWLALSTKTRGALWDLSSGDRKLFVRGFMGAFLADDGGGIGDFPRQDPLKHSLALLNPMTHEARPFREIPDQVARQYGGLLMVRSSLVTPYRTGTGQAGQVSKGAPDQSTAVQSTADQGARATAAKGGTSLGREIRFELRSIINDKVVWSRDFPKEAPGYYLDSYSGRLILYWTLGSDVGKAKLRDDPALAARAQELGNVDDDYVLEIVDALAGKTVGTLLLDTGKHSFDIRWGGSEGYWVVLLDTQNRVLVYSLKDGLLRHRFFGARAAINPKKDQIVVENYPGQLTFYSLETGESEARLTFTAATAFARFTLDGKKLFVLSGEQTAYAFDVDKLTPEGAARTQ